MWFKSVEDFDLDGICKCIEVLMDQFFCEKIDEIVLLDKPSYTEAKLSYEEDYGPLVTS